MTPFTHGLSNCDYIEMVRTVGDATDLLISAKRTPDAESAVATISRLGVLPAEDLDKLRVIAEEMFTRTVH